MIVHADNFSIYGSDTGLMTQGIYASANRCTLQDDPDGISSGKVLRPSETGGNAPRQTWRYNNQFGATNTVGVAMRVWMDIVPPVNDPYSFIQIRDANNNPLLWLFPNADGSLSIQTLTTDAGAGSWNVGHQQRTDIPVLTAKGWYHLELKFTNSGGGTGSYEVRVEGQTVLEGTDVAVRGDLPAIFSGGYYETTQFYYFYIKDLVIWDGQGSRNNDFLGSVLVTNLKVDSDVSLNWTPSTGTTGYTILDNVPPNDAQYLSAPYSVEAPNFPAAYEGTLSSLPIETTSVKGVITYVRAAKSDGGDGSLQVGLVSNPEEGAPVEVDGADRPITVAQTYWRDIFEIDPATSSAWTPASVNDANIKINRTT